MITDKALKMAETFEKFNRDSKMGDGYTIHPHNSESLSVSDLIVAIRELSKELLAEKEVSEWLARQVSYYSSLEPDGGCPNINCDVMGKCPLAEDQIHVCWLKEARRMTQR